MGSANRSKGSTATKPPTPPHPRLPTERAPPQYVRPTPNITVAATTNTADSSSPNNTTFELDPNTAAAVLRSVRRSQKQLLGGVEWDADRRRLAAVERALREQGVTP